MKSYHPIPKMVLLWNMTIKEENNWISKSYLNAKLVSFYSNTLLPPKISPFIKFLTPLTHSITPPPLLLFKRIVCVVRFCEELGAGWHKKGWGCSWCLTIKFLLEMGAFRFFSFGLFFVHERPIVFVFFNTSIKIYLVCSQKLSLIK